MIGWLLDLIFSNFWFVILVFWVLRFFAKGVREGGGKPRPRKHQEGRTYLEPRKFPESRKPEKALELSWETDIEKNMQADVVVEEEYKKAPIREKRGKETEPAESPALPLPVQGMIWSQVYGPPRSKNPHISRTTRKTR